MTRQQLYRSHNDRVIAGVAGGLGDYLAIDPVLIRLAWAALFFLGGSGLLLYILAWIVVPESPERAADRSSEDKTQALPEKVSFEGEHRETTPSSNQDTIDNRRRLVGTGLLILGLVFFVNEFAPRWVNTDLLWPLGLIGVGIVILSRRDQGGR